MIIQECFEIDRLLGVYRPLRPTTNAGFEGSIRSGSVSPFRSSACCLVGRRFGGMRAVSASSAENVGVHISRVLSAATGQREPIKIGPSKKRISSSIRSEVWR